MPRYKLTIEYDGTGFFGWQMQADAGHGAGRFGDRHWPHLHGVDILVQGAGRTDTGVHALEQVAHVDLPKSWDPFVLRNAINGNVRPYPVSVLEAEEVADDFHARFSATKRSYLYRIFNRRAPPALDLTRCGMCRLSLMPRPCTRPRNISWASMTSPPSAPPIARRNHR